MQVPTPPIAGPSSSTLCAQCQTNPSKYKCPRCGLATCSLACSKSHKSTTGCTGERDKTAKIPLKEYGYGAMMDDYKWLEEGRRRVEGWGQEIVDKGLDRTGIVEDARIAAAMKAGEGRGRGRGRGRGQQDGGRGRGRGGKSSASGRVGAGPYEDQGRRGEGKNDRGRGAGRGCRGRGSEGHKGSDPRPGSSTGKDAENEQGPPIPVAPPSVILDAAAPVTMSHNDSNPTIPFSLPPEVAVNAARTIAVTPQPAVFDQTIPRPSKSASTQPAQAVKGLALAYGSGSDSD